MLVSTYRWYGLGEQVTITAENRNLAARNGLLLRSVEKPYVIQGLAPDILGHVEIKRKFDGRVTAESHSRRLVMVLSDACKSCEQQFPHWRRLIELLPGSSLREAWIVSLDGELMSSSLQAQLQNRSIPFLALKIRDPIDFAVHTGISGVPMTLVLEGDRVSMAHMGVFTDRVYDTVRAGLLSPVSFVTRHLKAGQNEPLR